MCGDVGACPAAVSLWVGRNSGLLAFCLNGLFRSSPASGSGVVGRRCVDLRRAEGVQTTAAALHDAKAFTTARRLGIFSSKQQQPQKTARSGATDAATSARRTSDVASGHSAAPNSRRKRSAARSARHHAQIQVQLYRTAIAVIYFCRLRRKCRAQRLHAHLADLESLEAQSVRSDPGDAPLCFSSAPLATSVSKRAYRPPSSASSSVSLSDSSSSAALPAGFYLGQHPPLLNQPSGQRRQRHKATPVLPYAGRM